ncbi:hypothetical protein LEMLEM_LOCUS999, partial [Lemmus lemmus]
MKVPWILPRGPAALGETDHHQVQWIQVSDGCSSWCSQCQGLIPHTLFWIPSTRTTSTWTTDMVPLDKTSSPCQQ